MPLSTSIPAFSEGVPDALLFNTTILSSIVRVSVFTVVVLPDTVRLDTVKSPSKDNAPELATDNVLVASSCPVNSILGKFALPVFGVIFMSLSELAINTQPPFFQYPFFHHV